MRSCRVLHLAPAVALVCVCSSQAAELGRQQVGPGSGVTVEKAYRGSLTEAAPGVEACLNWSALKWDVGKSSNNDKIWSPEFALFYGISDTLDLRLVGRFYEATDQENLSTARIGVGSRAWFHTSSDWLPYAGLLINYYTIDIDGAKNEEGAFGLSCEIGAAYMMSENIALRLGLQAEATVMDGSARVNDGAEDVSIQGVGLSLGAEFVF